MTSWRGGEEAPLGWTTLQCHLELGVPEHDQGANALLPSLALFAPGSLCTGFPQGKTVE